LLGYKTIPLPPEEDTGRGLSAGRVQSATLKIIVDRERKIEKFQQKSIGVLMPYLEMV